MLVIFYMKNNGENANVGPDSLLSGISPKNRELFVNKKETDVCDYNLQMLADCASKRQPINNNKGRGVVIPQSKTDPWQPFANSKKYQLEVFRGDLEDLVRLANQTNKIKLKKRKLSEEEEEITQQY